MATLSRRSITLIAGLVLLLALGGIYIFLQNRPPAGEGETVERPETVRVTDLSRDDIAEITIESVDGSVTLRRELVERETEEGEQRAREQWTPVYPFPLELNNGNINRAVNAVAVMNARRVIEERAEDLAVYGLDDPRARIRAELADGSTVVLQLGSEGPGGGASYVRREGDPAVYLVGNFSTAVFEFTLADFRSRSLPQFAQDQVFERLLFSNGERTVEIVPITEEDRFDTEFALYKLVQPYDEALPADASTIEDVVGQIPTFRIDEFVDDNPESLALYGLDEPQGELLVNDGEVTLHLLFGDELEDGSRFAKEPDRQKVFTVDADLSFLDTTSFAFVDKFATLVNIDNVERIAITAPNEEYIVRLEREPLPSEDVEEGEEPEVEESFFVNDVEVEEDAFRDYYQVIIGLLFDAEASEPARGEAEVTVTYFLTDGETRRLSFVPLDRNFYSVYRRGSSRFVISRAQVQNLLDESARVIEEAQG